MPIYKQHYRCNPVIQGPHAMLAAALAPGSSSSSTTATLAGPPPRPLPKSCNSWSSAQVACRGCAMLPVPLYVARRPPSTVAVRLRTDSKVLWDPPAAEPAGAPEVVALTGPDTLGPWCSWPPLAASMPPLAVAYVTARRKACLLVGLASGTPGTPSVPGVPALLSAAVAVVEVAGRSGDRMGRRFGEDAAAAAAPADGQEDRGPPLVPRTWPRNCRGD